LDCEQKLNDADILSPQVKTHCLQACLVKLVISTPSLSYENLLYGLKRRSIINDCTTSTDAVSALNDLNYSNGYMVICDGLVVTSRPDHEGWMSFVLIGSDSHWHIVMNQKTYSGITDEKMTIGADIVSAEIDLGEACRVMAIVRSNPNATDQAIKQVEELLINIRGNSSYSNLIRYSYITGNLSSTGDLESESSLKATEILKLYNEFVNVNVENGNYKVRIHLIDVLMELCKNRICVSLLAGIMCILKGSREVRITCVVISIFNSCCVGKGNWDYLLPKINTENFIDLTKKDHEYNRKLDLNGGFSLNDSLKLSLSLYKQVLNGRVDGELNWKVELKKRTEGELSYKKTCYGNFGEDRSEKAYQMRFTLAVTTLISKTKIDNVMTIEEFMNNYYLLVVGGSFYDEVGKRKTDKYKDQLGKIDSGIKLNKRTVGLTSAYMDYKKKLLNINDQKCRLKTKGHQKVQEQVKERSIYQTTMLHYLACAYIFLPIEKNLSNENIFMNTDSYDNLRRTSKRLSYLKGYQLNSFDFEDFNAQHTFDDMRLVVRIICDRISMEIGDDETRDNYIKISKWVENSILNTYTVYKGKEYKWRAGLPSGVRYTSLMNNVLNYAYTVVTYNSLNTKQVEFKYKLENFEVCGDDSWHAFDSKEMSDLFNEEMIMSGHSLQLSKQKTSPNSFEFLRLQYFSNNMVSGCVNRSLSNLVCGNWEDDGSTNLMAFISEYYPNIIAIIKRGLSQWMSSKLLNIGIKNVMLSRYLQTRETKSLNEIYPVVIKIADAINIWRQVEKRRGGGASLLFYEKYFVMDKKNYNFSKFEEYLK